MVLSWPLIILAQVGESCRYRRYAGGVVWRSAGKAAHAGPV